MEGIEQDKLEDWASTAPLMGEIYGRGHLTIAATRSDNTNGGCFSDPRDELKEFRLGTTGLYARRHAEAFPDVTWDQNITAKYYEVNWPLLGRGWVGLSFLLSTGSTLNPLDF